MKYNLTENLSSRKGVISNLHGFLNRYLDGGFKTKWSGYWSPPYKYIDYFSFKVNGIWLNKDTLEGVEYGENIIYYHETGSLSIEEHISAPDSVPGLQIDLKIRNKDRDRKAVQAVLETGVDIRRKDQDVPEKDYELKKKDNRLNIFKGDRNLMILSDEGLEIEGQSYMKEHHPGEYQECFVPGDIVFRKEVPPESKETVHVEFITSDASFGTLESKQQELRNQELGRTFNYSIESMENLIYDHSGKGLIAGHPWFQEYWARDTFWTLLGLIDAGYFELSKTILENFAEKQVPGLIELDSGKDDGKKRADTLPLFVIAADKLRRHSGITEEIEEAMTAAMEGLELEEKVVQHPEDGTWMDTLERSPAIDIQALWLEAAEITDDERAETLREGLEKFRDGDYLKDSLGDNSPETINPAVPLMFDHFSKERGKKYLESINGEFSSQYGARTRAVTDLGYSGDGYHEGAVWGLTTMWASAANIQYGEETKGRNFMEKMTEFIDRNQPGALPEVLNAETGELLGCSEQAWSAGLYVHVLDSYLLGIKVKEDEVIVDPVGNFSGKRLGKEIHGESLDLKFEDGKVEILNEPDLDVTIGGKK